MSLTTNHPNPSSAEGVHAAMGLFTVVYLAFLVAYIVLLATCIRDILRHDFAVEDKILWIAAIVVIPVIGMLVYFLYAMQQHKKLARNSH